MDYIKIPIDSWTDTQISSIKEYANSNKGVNITDADVVTSAIDLLHHLYMLHSNMVLEARKDKHYDHVYKIIANELIFLQFLMNAPKNIEKIRKKQCKSI